MRQYATDQESSINVLRNKDHRFPELCAVLPELIPVIGLDAQRQWYLFEEVAPYCSNTVVCPRPECPKPVVKLETQTDSKLAHDIKKRKCSHCKQLGHCMSKGGKIKCPDLLEK